MQIMVLDVPYQGNTARRWPPRGAADHPLPAAHALAHGGQLTADTTL